MTAQVGKIVKSHFKIFYVFELAHYVKRELITLVTSKGSGKPAIPCSFARAFAVRSHKIWN